MSIAKADIARDWCRNCQTNGSSDTLALYTFIYTGGYGRFCSLAVNGFALTINERRKKSRFKIIIKKKKRKGRKNPQKKIDKLFAIHLFSNTIPK